MGSTYTVKIVDARLGESQMAALKRDIEQRLEAINRQVSHYDPESELSRFNRSAANTPFKASPDFICVLQHSLELNRLSQGAFDPTIGPLIDLWGFGARTAVKAVPTDAQIQEAMKKTGCRHVSVTAHGEVTKEIPDLTLNLSSAAKGFGSDEMARLLQARGLTNLYVSISGDVVTQGHNAQGQKWRVGISAPVPDWRPGDPMVTVLSLSGLAVSTSGDYQKYLIDAAGQRLGHIFDSKTGRPVQHNLASVSVVADSCMRSSSLATTLFVMGADTGLRFIEAQANAAALFVVRETGGEFRSIPSSRFAGLTGYKP